MIKIFKIGYYYKYICKKQIDWISLDKKKITNKVWNKCVAIIGNFNNFAQFEGMEYGWYWDYEDFIESKHHPIVKLLREL